MKRIYSIYITVLLSLSLLMCAQLASAEIFLNDDDKGWDDGYGDDPNVGDWDPGTKTATLTQDLFESVQINADGITLDGNGKTITGPGPLSGVSGVSLSGRTSVTIKNVIITNFAHGIYLVSSSDNTLKGNTTANNYIGIRLISSSGNKVYNNNFIGNTYQQAYVAGGLVNFFNQALPVGGNYWSDWDGPDGDGDDFVDSPYKIPPIVYNRMIFRGLLQMVGRATIHQM